MVETVSSLVALSDATAQLVERAATSIVSVRGGGRWHSSGIHWRSGIVVTAEEVLERDENIKLTLPGGRSVEASLVGRDPTTDVAALRFQPDGLPTAATTTAPLRPGETIYAIGNHDGSPLAAFGIVTLVGRPWRSSRGGTIDNFLRLDLTLSPAAEGGALIEAQGRVIGMTVLGPRRRALAIPTSTIERAVDQLLARGHVFRAYLGAGLRPLRGERRQDGSPESGSGRGVLVVDLDPGGPAKRAGLFLGDVTTSWNGKSIDRVRDVVHLLGPESVGTSADLRLVRGGATAAIKVTLGERPIKSVPRTAAASDIHDQCLDLWCRCQAVLYPRAAAAAGFGHAIVGIAGDQRSFVRLADRFDPDVILTKEIPSDSKLRVRDKGGAWLLFVDPRSERSSVEALSAGASAILPPSASLTEISAAIRLVAHGLVIFPQKMLPTLSSRAEIANERSSESGGRQPPIVGAREGRPNRDG